MPVNWEAISAIGQLVGAVAVVISLIYLASEVRRNTRAAQLAAMRSMSDAFNHRDRSGRRITRRSPKRFRFLNAECSR